MEKIIKHFVIIFMVIATIGGLSQLAFQNTIFAESMYPCCNNGYCDGSDCDDAVTVKVESDNCVTDYVINCATCVALIHSGQACGVRPVPPQCCDDQGEPNCGEPK